MPQRAKAVPEGYHTVTPFLVVQDATKAIEFYKQAFGAREVMRFDAPGGRIVHAQIKIGDSNLMMSDESPWRTHTEDLSDDEIRRRGQEFFLPSRSSTMPRFVCATADLGSMAAAWAQSVLGSRHTWTRLQLNTASPPTTPRERPTVSAHIGVATSLRSHTRHQATTPAPTSMAQPRQAT
jgi:uncharacterized glyoxalase superfamily protein PhnB